VIRRPETHRARLVAAFALAAGVVALAALSACSSGQITQTSSQVGAVPGANGNAGPGGTVALRNALIPYDGVNGIYPQGGNAPIEVRIFNNGPKTITLVNVTAEGTAAKVLPVFGARAAKPVPTTVAPTSASPAASGSASPSGGPSGAPTSATPSPTPPAPAPVATTISVAIAPSGYALLVPAETTYLQLTGLTTNLTPGVSVPVTFFFDDGSQVTLRLPVGPATVAVPRPSPVVSAAGG
jgi:hypothetical protein